MITVRERRDQHLCESGYSVAGYRARLLVVRLGSLPLPFPNPGVLHWHDLHHVATGFRTDLLGEAEISAYELRVRGRPAIITFLCVSSILLALFFAPRRVLAAWRNSAGCRGLYEGTESYEALLDLPLLELRRMLSIPPEGLST